jgi:hypothetical protein
MTATTEDITIAWSASFPLREAFLRQERGGGIYMWGFKNRGDEVVWYVGKATTRKGVYARLRKHYLDIMSGQYQIPNGYLTGSFVDAKCSESGWKIEYGSSETAATLNDWDRMERIFRAGHRFANEAFARVALLNTSDNEIKNIERQAIHSLRPTVNKQRPEPVSPVKVTFKEAANEVGWAECWLNHERTKREANVSGV